jgi:hypothetical protein
MTIYVPSLSSLVAKFLMVVERFLDEWVQLNVSSWVVKDATGPGALYGYVDNCAPYGNITGGVTHCGDIFVEQLEDLLHGGLILVNQLLGSLLAVQEVHTISP